MGGVLCMDWRVRNGPDSSAWIEWDRELAVSLFVLHLSPLYSAHHQPSSGQAIDPAPADGRRPSLRPSLASRILALPPEPVDHHTTPTTSRCSGTCSIPGIAVPLPTVQLDQPSKRLMLVEQAGGFA